MSKVRLNLRNIIVGAIFLASFLTLFPCCEKDNWNNNGDNGGNGNNGRIPTGITAVGSSSSSITISWNAVTDASSYNVWRSDNASGPYVNIKTVYWGTSFDNSNLAAYTTFYYKVSAGDGPQSSAVSATTFLLAPSGVEAISKTSSSITISWENLLNATSYRIHRMENSFDPNPKVFTSSTTSFTDTGLPSNVQCHYAVSGYNNITEGDKSYYVSATTLLKAPTGVTAIANSSSEITITWNAVTDAYFYKVYRSDNISGPYIEIASYIHGTSYTNNGLSPITTFYYKVAAHDGEQSDAVSATTH